MKSTVLLIVVAGLMSIGAAVMADPIMRAADSVPVTIDIAKWVWIDLISQDVGFLLDYEAGYPYADATLPLKCGHNCNVRLSGTLTPPPGAPGTWAWWYQGDGQSRRLLLDGPVSHPDVLSPAGEYMGRVTVRVSGIHITDRSTTYTGGVMTITVDAL